MTDEVSNTAGAIPSSRVRPVNRLRLAQRVVAQLVDLGEDVLVEVDNEGRVHEERFEGLASDFLLASLDLRIRLTLLVPGEVDNSQTPGRHVSAALALLDLYPDTDAIVVIADDDDLNCIIVEPYDRQEALLLPSGGQARENRLPKIGPAPLRSSLSLYLRLLSPVWEEVATLPVIESIDTREIAERSASQTLLELRQANFRVPEKLAARDQLSGADADFAVALTMRLLGGEFDVLTEIEKWVNAT